MDAKDFKAKLGALEAEQVAETNKRKAESDVRRQQHEVVRAACMKVRDGTLLHVLDETIKAMPQLGIRIESRPKSGEEDDTPKLILHVPRSTYSAHELSITFAFGYGVNLHPTPLLWSVTGSNPKVRSGNNTQISWNPSGDGEDLKGQVRVVVASEIEKLLGRSTKDQ